MREMNFKAGGKNGWAEPRSRRAVNDTLRSLNVSSGEPLMCLKQGGQRHVSGLKDHLLVGGKEGPVLGN